MINLSLNAVITIMMIFHLPKHSPVSLAWLVFSAVFLRLSLQYLCQIKPVRNTRNTKPRPMTIVINIGDFRSLNTFLTSSPCFFCFAEFCRIKQKDQNRQISAWNNEDAKGWRGAGDVAPMLARHFLFDQIGNGQSAQMADSEWVNTFGASLVAKHFSPYSSRRFEAQTKRTKAPVK